MPQLPAVIPSDSLLTRISRIAGGSPRSDLLDTRFAAQANAWGQSFGWPAHIALAMLWIGGAAGPIAAVEVLPIPLAICVLARLHVTIKLWPFALSSRLLMLCIAFAAWSAFTLAWSPDRTKGIQEIGNTRWLWCILGVLPVLHKRSWLIAALIAGTLLGMGTQLLEAVGHRFGIDALIWPHPPNPQEHARISGWWHHPVMGGIILVGSLGLHLPPAVFGKGWRRWAGIAGSTASLIAMVATGTRSAWLAAFALIAIILGSALFRLPKAKALRLLAGAAIIATVLAGTLWAVRGDAIAARVRSATTEVSRAFRDREYTSDSGARINFAIWASRMIAQRPLVGHGAGSYEPWVRATLAKDSIDPASVRIAPQAHNTLLHAWATLGLPGPLLLGSILLVAACGGVVVARETVPVGHDWAGTYGIGPSSALLGIALVSCFDTIYVNVQPAAFTSALLALCLPLVPTAAKTSADECR